MCARVAARLTWGCAALLTVCWFFCFHVCARQPCAWPACGRLGVDGATGYRVFVRLCADMFVVRAVTVWRGGGGGVAVEARLALLSLSPASPPIELESR
jgi:hypothetical protein